MALSPALRNKLIAAAGGGALAIAAALIPNLEGVKYKPYLDVGGVLTVCYGHTGPDIIRNKTYTEAECKAMLNKDLQPFARSVERSVKVPTTEYQKAALISFSYNVGVGAFEKSTLLKDLNARRYAKSCEDLKAWVYAGKKQWAGLMNRREIEQAVCLMGQS